MSVNRRSRVSHTALLTVVFTVLLLSATTEKTAAQNAFLRGDINTDGRVSVSDSLMLRRFLFNGGARPTCMDAADFDDDGEVNISDEVYILNFLFQDTAGPGAPFPDLGTDPTEDRWDCGRYDVVAPEETDDLVDLADLTGAPGETVAIPVLLTNARAVEALQLVVSYDPDLFTPVSGRDGISFEGSFYENKIDQTIFYAEVTPLAGNAFRVGFVSSVWETGFEIPPGVETVAFNIVGVISESAPPGAVVRLDPTNGPDGAGSGPARMLNELTHRGQARYVSTVPQTDGMVLQILGDQIFFRGDANADSEVNLSDVQFTLNYLFKSGAPPACADAADANDDGTLTITDPVVTLMYLFAGKASLPPPHPQLGPDPTEDLLGCGGAST